VCLFINPHHIYICARTSQHSYNNIPVIAQRHQTNFYMNQRQRTRRQKMLCDNFYKACCDQWGVSRERRSMENALLMSTDVGTHSESAELTVRRRRRSLPAAPRAHLCEKGFAAHIALCSGDWRGAAWPSENFSLFAVCFATRAKIR
jgi:hypothetical protein